MYKNLKRILIYILILITFTLLITLAFSRSVKAEGSSGSLYLNKLKFYVVVNEDGSMDVTETWDVDINRTKYIV